MFPSQPASRRFVVILLGKRSYVSRAHSKPRPEFSIGEALQSVLEGVDERKAKRAQKWERNADQRAKKGIKEDGPFRNQDETIELALNLNLDPRKPGQALRGSVSLPHGTGKTVRCAVFTKSPEVAAEALARGAVHSGGEELVDRIVSGLVPLDFDRSLASQDVLSYLSQKLARTLGPRGLMPNAKVGTLVKTPDALLGALEGQLAGRLQYRTDKEGVVHLGVGKGSFGADKLLENIRSAMDELHHAKPELYGKGKKPSKSAPYFLRAHVTATQGKSMRVDLRTVDPTSIFFMGNVQN